MSRTAGKAIHVLKDIWIAYAEKLLKKDPNLVSKYANKTRHYVIGYMEDGKFIEVLSYPKYRRTVERYFDKAKRAIIQGEAINMGGGVGKICGKRVERDFRKQKQRRVNWHKTRQLPKVWDEAKQKWVAPYYIYFTSNEWCRIAWVKNELLKNETVYEFAPASRNSAGTSGFKLEFSQAQKEDPLLQYRYLYNPLKLTKA